MDKNVKRLRFFWGVLRVEGELKKERFVLRVGTLRLTFLEHFVLRIIKNSILSYHLSALFFL